jgi:hypothetical protein
MAEFSSNSCTLRSFEKLKNIFDEALVSICPSKKEELARKIETILKDNPNAKLLHYFFFQYVLVNREMVMRELY